MSIEDLSDPSFETNLAGLAYAAELLASPPPFTVPVLQHVLPKHGIGEMTAL